MERKVRAGILASPGNRGYSCGTAPDWTGLPPLGAALPGGWRTCTSSYYGVWNLTQGEKAVKCERCYTAHVSERLPLTARPGLPQMPCPYGELCP
jgi:hypothetical protein